MSFHQALGDKIHSNIPLKKNSTKRPKSMHSQLENVDTAESLVLKAASAAMAKSKRLKPEPILVSTQPPEDTPRLISGPAEKKAILADYQKKFETDPNKSIVTKPKGKHWLHSLPSQRQFYHTEILRHDPSQDYRVNEVFLHNILPIILARMYQLDAGWISGRDLTHLHRTSKLIHDAVSIFEQYSHVDFSALKEPRYSFSEQKEISEHRVAMNTAAFLHFGMDPGNLARFIGKEDTGQHRDID